MLEYPLVSVAIPAYKSSFLRQAIDSVLAQTFSDWELIIVNDASPEPVSEIVNGYEDSRIRYYINETNLGMENPAMNWNRCLRYAKGEFFCLLCDDDIFAPEFIETMLGLSSKYPDVGVFRSRAMAIDQNGKLLDFYPSSPEYESAINYMIDMGNGMRKQTISEFMYRTDFIRRHGEYANLPKAMCADHLTIYRLGMAGGIASSIKPLVSFRLSNINLSGKGQDNKNIKEKLTANNLFVEEVGKLVSSIGDKQISNMIINKHKEKFAKANVIVISCASMSVLLFLLRHKKKYKITIPLLIKGVMLKFKKVIE